MKLKTVFFLSVLLVLFTNLQAQWEQLGQSIYGDHDIDQSGQSVSLSDDGNALAIGAILNDGNGLASGQVRVYRFINNNWSKIGSDIYGEAGDYLGYSVCLNADGSIIAIGSPKNDSGGHLSGCVRIYHFIDNDWVQMGEDIIGKSDDQAGSSLSLNANGTMLAIGNPSSSDIDTTSVRVYHFVDGKWDQLGQTIYGTVYGDHIGSSVSLSSNDSVLAVGVNGNDNFGYARIFKYNSGSWQQIGQNIIGEYEGDRFGMTGISLNANGSVVAIGAERNSGNGYDAGNVRVYRFDNDLWTQLGEDIDGDADDWSGHSVSLSSDGLKVTIGSPWSNDAGLYAGKVRVYCYEDEMWKQMGNSMLGLLPDYNMGYSLSLSSDALVVATGAPGAGKGYTNIYRFCQSFADVDIVACNSYTVPSGDETYFISGVYYDTIPNTAGCDSILKINLTINSVDTSVTNSDPVLTANAENASYQWLDCNNNFEKIAGETGREFTASVNGSYAVEVSTNNCIDTSSCFSILKAAVLQNKFDSFVKVFPTIADNYISIECLSGSAEKVTIYDLYGRLIFSKSNLKELEVIDISTFNQGTYFVEVITNERKVTQKFIKE